MIEPIDPKLYRLMIEQNKDYALFLLGPDGRILTWGAGAQRIKGYDEDEIIGRHFSVFYTREAYESGWPAHELKVAAAEGRFEDEGWRVRKDGSQFWANVVITALRDEDGKLLGYSKITRDLTGRRMIEEALRQSEERFRLLVDGVADYAIYMLDPEGLVTSWNTGAERIKGYSREEIIGKHFSRFYDPRDIEIGKPWEELATARRSGRAEDEGWRLKKNGERFWARVVVTPLYDASGHMRGFAKVTQDLTERRYVQDLEQAARNVSEFISTLTHELRNPLAPIRTAIQVIGYLPNVDPALDAMHRTIDRQSAHLSRILDDMMDVARIARGKMTVETKTVDVGEVVQRAVETARPAIETGKHQLGINLPPTGVFVSGDFHRLTQLLTNLLNNAARYTPEGGRITVSVNTEEGTAVIRVRDNGRGIEPQHLQPIFNMFVQGRQFNDQAGRGLGVGLALARSIAELHGGTLTAFSEGENKGSEFTVRLPALDIPMREQPPANVGLPSQALVARRILVVDDNVDAAETLHLLLKSLGHETCVANDGVKALKMAKEFRPDIVLLDLGMPGMDGYETARRLAALKKDQTFRIVAVSGWGQAADRQKSRDAGFDLHLVKPVGLEDLVQAVSQGTKSSPKRTLH
jgi:PAS domain S-box-containing protein